MSKRAWQIVEDVLGKVVLGKDKEGTPEPAAEIGDTLDDRTRNEHVNDAYVYGTIDTSTVSIRLLELLPGTRQDDITCRLADYPLDSCHGTYEALSYSWGDITELTPIQVNEKTLLIGENLRCALLNIRKTDLSRLIWVDAICIWQGNLRERNHQVSIMDKIYRSASRTIIWLGDAHPVETKRAYSILEKLSRETISRQQTGVQGPAPSNDLTLSLLDRHDLESEVYEEIRNDMTIVHVAGAKWWFRAWTIQEILLAQEAIVVMGKYSMDWDRFCSAVDHGLAIGIWDAMVLGILVDPIVVPYVSMHTLRSRLQSSNSTSATISTAPAQSFLELLIHCRFRAARDPRDKVYSLLGLIAHSGLSPGGTNVTGLGIEPDYLTPTSDIYRNTAQQLIVQSGTLNILGACLPGSVIDVPSWVPDWSEALNRAPQPLMHDVFGRPRQTHATGRRDNYSPWRFVNNGHVLVLIGHEVTTITTASPVLERLMLDEYSTDPDDGPSLFDGNLLSRLAKLPRVLSGLRTIYEALACIVPHLAVFSDWESFARKDPPTNPQKLQKPTSGYDPLSVYWQTLCTGALVSSEGGLVEESKRVEETARLFYMWRANLKPVRDLHRWHVDRISRPLAFVGYLMHTWRQYADFARFLETAYERRLGRGANGYLTLLPAAAEVGDRVVLVEGGLVPLVLRPKKGGPAGVYTFVGEAYVHGIMDGEGFDETKCAEMNIH